MNRRRLLLAGAGTLVLVGCTSPKRQGVAKPVVTTPTTAWSGRLSLRVEDDATQSFAALFELRGAPRAGELILTSPIGNTLAQLRWAPGQAVLRNGNQTQRHESIDALVNATTGAAVPVAALFAWLSGRDEQVPGWRVDLSQVASGRLQATRESPTPRADLRIVFEPL